MNYNRYKKYQKSNNIDTSFIYISGRQPNIGKMLATNKPIYQKSSGVDQTNRSYISNSGEGQNVVKYYDTAIRIQYKGEDGNQFIPPSGQSNNIHRQLQPDQKYFKDWKYDNPNDRLSNEERNLFLPKSGKPENIHRQYQSDLDYFDDWNYGKTGLISKKDSNHFIPSSGQQPNIHRQNQPDQKYFKDWKYQEGGKVNATEYIPFSGKEKNVHRQYQFDQKYFTDWDYKDPDPKKGIFYQFTDEARMLYIGKANKGENVKKFIPDINKKFWIKPGIVKIDPSNIMKLKIMDILKFTFPMFKKSYVPIAWFGRTERGPVGGEKFRYNAPWSIPLAADIVQSQITDQIRKGLSKLIGKATNTKGQRASRLFDYKFDSFIDESDPTAIKTYQYAVPMLPIAASSGKYYGILPAPVRMIEGIIRAAFSSHFLKAQHKRVQNNIQIAKTKWQQFLERNGKKSQFEPLIRYKQKPNEETKTLIIGTSTKQRNTLKLWKNTENQVMIDSLSYQVEAYKHSIWYKNKAQDQFNDQVYDKDKGSLIKFQIQDVNNMRLLTTPAFLSKVEDKGLQGQWQDIQYIGGHYPKFQYKGMDKRVISFELLLGCFQQQFLPQYIEKLNFFRGVGSPSFKQIMIGNKDKQRTIQMRQAPIYKLTLGDIIYDTYGYFSECEITWQQEAVWNLDRSKLLKMLNMPTKLQKDINDIQIPLYTKISMSFVCMYGASPANTDEFYRVNGAKEVDYIYDDNN